MNTRIKALRKQLGLNQTDFGAQIGVSQTAVASYENGARVPLDAVILSICRVYNVNETWLRAGEGEMFREIDKSEELAAFFGDVLRDKPDFRYRLISVLARMTTEEWQMLERKAQELAAGLAEGEKKDDP